MSCWLDTVLTDSLSQLRQLHVHKPCLALPDTDAIVGSTLALRWLRPDWVAPLGATSLIFNFLFASWLVGTRKWSASHV